jgi:hypothetical protein
MLDAETMTTALTDLGAHLSRQATIAAENGQRDRASALAHHAATVLDAATIAYDHMPARED